MKIAVIGTGTVGRALGGSFVRAGHDVTLAARDAAKTRTVAQELGARAVDDVAQAAADADVVVLATPYSATDALASQLAPVAAGKVVVEASNPLTPDYSAIATAGGPSAAEQLAGSLKDAAVVKAFNTMFSGIQADPGALGTPADGLFATDDDSARATIAELLSSIGARPVYVGPLARARELEALGFLNIGIQMLHGGDWRSAIVFVGVPAAATKAPAAAHA
jgi:predicted dinucleotide-binding enzyme